MHRSDTANDLGLFVLRLVFGGYFAWSGVITAVGEIRDGLGSFYRGQFKGLQPTWLPDVFAAPYGYALPWLEIVLGAMLIVGVLSTAVAIVIGLMIASFTLALALKMGWTVQGANAPGPFGSNYLHLAAYVAMAVMGPGRWSIDAARGGRV
ncbi:MAG: DoxX family protein [Planctomycetota bacterium]